jgi:hypothetical protein
LLQVALAEVYLTAVVAVLEVYYLAQQLQHLALCIRLLLEQEVLAQAYLMAQRVEIQLE